jgi:bifunctional pyridoxal-dependent enzyme with beta-cystathionase and maltose regulon repressor activities
MQDKVLDYIKAKVSMMLHQSTGTSNQVPQCIPSLEASALTYHDGPYGSKRLRQVMATFVNNRFRSATPVTMDQVSFATGVTALNEVIAHCITDGESDGLLLGMPVYGSFAPDMQSTSRHETPWNEYAVTDTVAAVT